MIMVLYLPVQLPHFHLPNMHTRNSSSRRSLYTFGSYRDLSMGGEGGVQLGTTARLQAWRVRACPRAITATSDPLHRIPTSQPRAPSQPS